MKKVSIPVLHNFQPNEFRDKFFLTQKPVVLKGLVDKCPASEKWNLDYIREICGDVVVDVYDNSRNNSGSAYTKADLQMKFSEYLNEITSNDNSSLRMFLFNMFKRKPALRKDFPCPDIFRGVLGRIGFMFFGAKGIKVRIHQDIDMSNVLLTQFHGRKRVWLVSPEQSTLLYRLPFNTYSLVNLDEPDFTKYPALKHIDIQECVLEPGDSLYMPSGYWHYITYLDSGFSVSYRKMAHNLKFKTRGILFFLIYMPFDKLMNVLFDKSWLNKKQRMAEIRAHHAVNRLKEKEKIHTPHIHLQPH